MRDTTLAEMSCGVCNPNAFREALNTEGGYVYGYTCSKRPEFSVRQLYYMGAQHVMWDYPSPTNTLKRNGLKLLLKLLRKGDTLIISKSEDLGRATLILQEQGTRIVALTNEKSGPVDEPLFAPHSAP